MIDELCSQLVASETALADVCAELASVEEQLAHANERLSEAWDKACENPDIDGPEVQSLAEAVNQACEEAYAQGRNDPSEIVRDALRAYLVSLGLPADPVKLDDPHLDALATALL